MDRKQAYDFFLKALTAHMVRVMNELDSAPVGSPQYAALTEKQIRIQNALANLDDIANLV
jgi:hypothetical protein